MDSNRADEAALAALKTYPGMTRWFDPRLLVKLLFGAVVSSLFSHFADRRLIVAALDHDTPDEALARARLRLAPDEDGAVWIDYVSDLGDGFDATYAIAYLLAQERLTIEPPLGDGAPGAGSRELPRAGLLVMGGDEVYPTASREAYNRRLREPYGLARPRLEGEAPTPVLMIPGNHDWYDGLVSFLALFCRSKPTSLGGWATCQRRSYFAVELVAEWWLWAVDIALTEDMDQPQADYFVAMTEAMPSGARIVLCSAEPSWYDGDRKSAGFRSLDYAAKLADNAGKDFRIVLALSGDSHHYARYSSRFGTEFVTAGGGGAFLHGTQGLRRTIRLSWLRQANAELTLRNAYPGREESQRLLLRNLLFPVTNPEFAILLGAVYWILACWLARHPQLDGEILASLALAAGFGAYAHYRERGTIERASLDPDEAPDPVDLPAARGRTWLAVMLPAWTQALCHLGMLLVLWRVFERLNLRAFGVEPGGSDAALLLLLELVPAGGLAAGLIFGAFLWFTSRVLDMNHDDAFSALRLERYRCLLRIKIQGDTLTLYPIGLDRVPRRRDWRLNPDRGEPPVRSVFVPAEPLRPRLIEPEIVIRAGRVGTVAGTVKPEALTGPPPEGTPTGPEMAPPGRDTGR